jgi:hypothetical protein
MTRKVSRSPTTSVVDIRPVIVRHLNQIELSRRWNLSARTLERWRWLGEGPQYLKIGGRVVYRLDDVEAYEAQQVRTSTASSAGAQSRASRG